MIIPRVQEEKVFDEKFCLGNILKVAANDEIGKKAIEVLKIFLPSAEIVESDTPGIYLTSGNFDKKEAYSIEVSDKIEIKYSDFLGARNAISTLAQMVRTENGELYINKCEIFDYPTFSYRSFMLDLARGIGRKEEIKETLIRFALLKYNTVHLHLTDSEGLAWQSAKHPKIHGPKGDQYSMQYYKGVDKLCRTLGLDVIPELDVPGHATAFMEVYPELKCLTDIENEAMSPWSFCAGNEDFYTMCDDLIGEIIEMFPSCKYVHIGGDEVEMADIDNNCYWTECKRCKTLGFDNKQEYYYYVIKRLYDIVKAHGREVIMWNDWIDISKECPLPKDIVIEFWRVALEQRGPFEGCSMQKFLEQGYKVINAYFWETYICLYKYASEVTLNTWLPTLRPETDEKYHNLIIGGECCAWEFGNELKYRFYAYTLPAASALFIDRLWNGSQQEYDSEYKKAITRAILGLNCPEELDIFEYLGTIMLPAQKELLGIIENIKATNEEISDVEMKLVPIAAKEEYGQYAALAFLKCLEWIKENKQ